MDILKIHVIQAFIRMCQDGWDQGWHERNGGNLTYRMTQSEIDETNGMVMIPITKPAASALSEDTLTPNTAPESRNNGATTKAAKNP